MLSDIHCPLHLSLHENTPETVNVKNHSFTPKWTPQLNAQFTETLENENIEVMVSNN